MAAWGFVMIFDRLRETSSSWLSIARAAIFTLLTFGLPSIVEAQDRIGVASIVQNDVSHGPRSSPRPLATGDGVVRSESVRTGLDSSTKLVFRDDTNLSIGPRAVITLDEAVFSDSPQASLGIRLVEGTVRYVSGKLPKESYNIQTPTATIGIRGTEFDVDATSSLTTVTLRAGIVVACTRRAVPQRCITLSTPGDTAILSASAARQGSSGSGRDFSRFCGGAAGLCTATTLAERQGSPIVAALCGR